MTASKQQAEPVRTLPSRLHHNAFVVADQERTRHFYEDILGLPLRATWIETADYEGDHLEYSHTFYGLADGGALAFFNFADPRLQAKFAGAHKQNVFHHIALKADAQTQAGIRRRCGAAGVQYFDIDHGYCKSIYIRDPDGMLVEFTVDPPNVAEIDAAQAASAHEMLKAWQNGRREPNNLDRHK